MKEDLGRSLEALAEELREAEADFKREPSDFFFNRIRDLRYQLALIRIRLKYTPPPQK